MQIVISFCLTTFVHSLRSVLRSARLASVSSLGVNSLREPYNLCTMLWSVGAAAGVIGGAAVVSAQTLAWRVEVISAFAADKAPLPDLVLVLLPLVFCCLPVTRI